MTVNGQQRRDAVRNRTRILETAAAEITSRGPGVPMEEIARAAGVAVGTLYRHFPTKADLVAAALEQHIGLIAEQLESALHRIADGVPSGEEIRNLLFGWVDTRSDSRILKEAAKSLDAYRADSEEMARMDAALRGVLQHGVASGALRPDVEPEDIYLLMSTMPAGELDAARRRWAEIVSRGLLRAESD